MANGATLRLDRLVLEDERSLFIRVTRVANRIPRRRRAQLPANKSSVGIVAVRALNQSFFHAVVERHVELRFFFLVACVAQAGLTLNQQRLVR